MSVDLLFESAQSFRGSFLAVDDTTIHFVSRSVRPTLVRTMTSLRKRSMLRVGAALSSLHIDGDHWIAGTYGGVLRSGDRGLTWQMEAVSPCANQTIGSLARFNGALWVAGETVAVERPTGWVEVPLPGGPREYSDLQLTVAGEDLYVVGQRLWRIDNGQAVEILSCKRPLTALVETEAKTLVVAGWRFFARRPSGGDWTRETTRRNTVGLALLPEGLLEVSTRGRDCLRLSRDDGRTFQRLSLPPTLQEALETRPFQDVAADGQGGAIACGVSELGVRVASPDRPWTAPPTRSRRRRGSPPARTSRAVSAADAAPFLEAICRAPDDVDARLVYADWLTERGDPRGEFISIQCELGRPIHGAGGSIGKPRPTHLANLVALESREASLFKQHRARWMESTRGQIKRYWWRRGFLEGGRAGPGLLPHVDEIFKHHPIIDLRFQGMSPADIAAVSAIELPAVRCLRLVQQRLTPALLDTLLEAPWARTINSLDIWGNDFGDDGAAVLAERLPTNIKQIDLSLCAVARDGFRRLLDAATGLEVIVGAEADDRDALASHARGSVLVDHPSVG